MYNRLIILMLQLVNMTKSAVESNEYTVGICRDLSKAFDTVDHKVLISKRALWCSWHYTQKVQKLSSEACEIKCRVPKGSILGPLLFLPSAMVQFLIIFVICSLLQARYIRITQEILAFFICLIVELIFENSQFGFKGPKFFKLAKS